MNVLRWCVFIAAAIVLLFVYGIWKQLDAKYGGGFVSGFLRGLIILAPLYFLWGWAKDKKGINRLNPPRRSF